MSKPVKVTVTDPETGEVEYERLLEDDYLLICNGDRYLSNSVAHRNGTEVLTVKRDDNERSETDG